MKKIYNLILMIIIILLKSNSIFSAGIYQNQNQSAEFIRTINRNATTDVDAVYFNPAATAYLKDGIYIYVSNQYITDIREVKNSSRAIQTFKTIPSYQNYTGKASTLIYPDLYLVYKNNKLAIFSSGCVIGAGASATFKKGLPMFDTLALGYIAAKAGGFENIVDYKASIYMEGVQAMLGASVGTAYAVNDVFSVALGIRYVRFMQSALIKFKWHSVKTTTPPYDRLEGAQGALDFHDMFIDMSASGNAASYIFGIHIRPIENMNIGLKYEYHTTLKVKNDTKIMHIPIDLENMEDVRKGLDSYRDNSTSKKTFPMIATAGISYLFFSKLKAEANFTYFFNKSTDWGRDQYGFLIAKKFKNGYDIGLALEYSLLDNLKISSGFTYSISGRTEKSSNDVDVGLDALTIGTGFTFAITDDFQFTISGMRVIFRNESINNDLSHVPDNNKAWLIGKTLLSEKTWVIAFGVTYRISSKDSSPDKGDGDKNKNNSDIKNNT